MKALVTAEEHGTMDTAVQALYKEDGDAFIVDVTPVDGWALENVKGLKSSLQKERSRGDTGSKLADELQAKFKDIDPVKAREALDKMKELEDWDPEKKLAEAKSQFEASLTSKFGKDKEVLVTKHSADMEALNKKYSTVSGQLRTSIVDAEAIRAISEAKGATELLLPIVRSAVRMVEQEDGTFKPAIMDGEQPRLSPKSGSTDWMSIAEYIEELRQTDAYARAFDGSGASGSGATGNNSGSPGSSFRISASDAKDPARYRAAKAQAEKSGRELQIG